jgi:hypothetical protein
MKLSYTLWRVNLLNYLIYSLFWPSWSKLTRVVFLIVGTYRDLCLNYLEARESKYVFEQNYFEFIIYFALLKFLIIHRYLTVIKTKTMYFAGLEFFIFGSFYAPRQADSLINGFLVKSELWFKATSNPTYVSFSKRSY